MADNIDMIGILQKSREALLSSIKLGEDKIKELEVIIENARIKLQEVDDLIIKL
jgi:hypothetical protein